MAGARSAWERIRLAMWRAVVEGKRRVCPMCLTSVGDEDAIGLVGEVIGHAECALVRWIRSGHEPRDALSGDELYDAISAAGRSR
jgi:hypothetical protein